MKTSKNLLTRILAVTLMVVLCVGLASPGFAATNTGSTLGQGEFAEKMYQEFKDPQGRFTAYVDVTFSEKNAKGEEKSGVTSEYFDFANISIYTTGQGYEIQSPEWITDWGWKDAVEFHTEKYAYKTVLENGIEGWKIRTDRWSIFDKQTDGDFLKFKVVNTNNPSDATTFTFGKGFKFGLGVSPGLVSHKTTSKTLAITVHPAVAAIAGMFDYEVLDTNDMTKYVAEGEKRTDSTLYLKDLKPNTEYMFHIRVKRQGEEGPWSYVYYATTSKKPSAPQIKSVKVTKTKKLGKWTMSFPARWTFSAAHQQWQYQPAQSRTFSGGKQLTLKVTLKKALKKGEKLYAVAGSDVIALNALTKSKSNSKIYTGKINVNTKSSSAKIRFYTAVNEKNYTGTHSGGDHFSTEQLQSSLTAKKTVKC